MKQPVPSTDLTESVMERAARVERSDMNWRKYPSADPQETAEEYMFRLEAGGASETPILKKVREQFDVSPEGVSQMRAKLTDARQLEVALNLRDRNRSFYSAAKWVERSYNMTFDEAGELLHQIGFEGRSDG